LRKTNDVDVLLEVLGNDTRRRILQLLADEPRYFIQLSRDLGVSQQAVLKHLEILERHGFVVSFEGDSDFAAPKRKYFQLNRSCMLAVGITNDAVQFAFHDICEAGKDRDSGRKENAGIKIFQKKAGELEREKDHSKIVEMSDELLREINRKLEDLASQEISLLRLRQKITRTAHQAIRGSFERELERYILYSTIGTKERPGVNQLSETLDAREREIDDAMKSLKRRLSKNSSLVSSE
jgi:ArsR family transcriptional regulator